MARYGRRSEEAPKDFRATLIPYLYVLKCIRGFCPFGIEPIKTTIIGPRGQEIVFKSHEDLMYADQQYRSWLKKRVA
jgi:hypothetical protein